jgi:hypothetical protein
MGSETVECIRVRPTIPAVRRATKPAVMETTDEAPVPTEQPE